MAITAGIPIRLDISSWEVPFTTDRTPPVDIRVCVNGAVVNQYTLDGTADSVRVQCQPGEGIALEILDSEAAILSPAFPGRLTLNWTAVTSAKSYRVEEYVAAVWTERETITARGETAFSWETRWLENQTTFQFRVIPITAGGTEGTALTYSALMVRADEVPDVTYTYAAGTGKVTIAAA